MAPSPKNDGQTVPIVSAFFDPFVYILVICILSGLLYKLRPGCRIKSAAPVVTGNSNYDLKKPSTPSIHDFTSMPPRDSPWDSPSKHEAVSSSSTAPRRMLTSGDLAKMLSLPSPNVRRHSYPAELETNDHLTQRRYTKGRVGSVTSIGGVSIVQKDMVMEKDGWRRHVKVYGQPTNLERMGTW